MAPRGLRCGARMNVKALRGLLAVRDAFLFRSRCVLATCSRVSPSRAHRIIAAPAPSQAMSEKVEKKSVQTFGKKKTATAVAFCAEGKGSIKVNGCPLDLVEPEVRIARFAFASFHIVRCRRSCATRCSSPSSCWERRASPRSTSASACAAAASSPKCTFLFCLAVLRARCVLIGRGCSYAIRQAIAKAMVAYYQKYVDETSKKVRLLRRVWRVGRVLTGVRSCRRSRRS